MTASSLVHELGGEKPLARSGTVAAMSKPTAREKQAAPVSADPKKRRASLVQSVLASKNAMSRKNVSRTGVASKGRSQLVADDTDLVHTDQSNRAAVSLFPGSEHEFLFPPFSAQGPNGLIDMYIHSTRLKKRRDAKLWFEIGKCALPYANS